MKKYSPFTMNFVFVICILAFLIIFTMSIFIVGFSLYSVTLGIIAGSAFASLILLFCRFYLRSSTLIIDEEKITLPRGADINGKTAFSNTTIMLNEIHTIESRLLKGIIGFSKDTYFHTITLNNGTKITITLFAYGIREKEILEVLQNKIAQITLSYKN